MESRTDSQISGHQHNSTTVWSQPSTPEQRHYYSKHAAEKRVFGWITTLLQTAHGAIAFAAWTAIYLWVFKKIPFMLPLAPIIAGGTLVALHVLFRTTWQTFWYDKLDTDPNTDSPIWVPLAIVILLLGAEVQGAKQYLAGQVEPAAAKETGQTDAEYNTTIASIEQAYRNEAANIADVYKAKTAPLDRQIAAARARSADNDAERRQQRARIATLQAQRDAVLTQKAAALEKALATATESRNKATARRDEAIAVIDTHNAGELARYTAEMGSVSAYAWVLSVGLLFLIAGLSYRTVRINVKSGILPLRNYTILDAHGSIPERICTAITDALNRRSLQFAVFIHRFFSPKKAITSFDGTVVAQPGTYNTPEGFYPGQHGQHQVSDHEASQKVLHKFYIHAAQNPGWQPSEELYASEIQKAKTLNGTYNAAPLGKTEPSPAPARASEGTPTPPAPHLARYGTTPDGYAELIRHWRGHVEAQLQAYDQAVLNRQPGAAAAIQDYVFTDPNSHIVKEAKRLHLEYGIREGDFVVRRRDRQHYTPLHLVTFDTLDQPHPAPSPAASDDEELFKQNPNLFKQNILPQKDASGRVIGIQYKKKDGNWTAYDYNTVSGQYRIYRKRADKGEASEAVADGLEKWEYAMSLFQEGREELASRPNLQPIALDL